MIHFCTDFYKSLYISNIIKYNGNIIKYDSNIIKHNGNIVLKKYLSTFFVGFTLFISQDDSLFPMDVVEEIFSNLENSIITNMVLNISGLIYIVTSFAAQNASEIQNIHLNNLIDSLNNQINTFEDDQSMLEEEIIRVWTAYISYIAYSFNINYSLSVIQDDFTILDPYGNNIGQINPADYFLERLEGLRELFFEFDEDYTAIQTLIEEINSRFDMNLNHTLTPILTPYSLHFFLEYVLDVQVDLSHVHYVLTGPNDSDGYLLHEVIEEDLDILMLLFHFHF